MEDKGKTPKKKITLRNIGIDKLLLLGLAGVVLVIASIPFSNKVEKVEDNTTKTITESNVIDNVSTYELELEIRIEEILAKIEGVGKVDVMITVKDLGEKIVDSEKPYSKSDTSEIDSEGGTRTVTDITQSDTTIYSVDENGNSIPYVVKELEPQIEGVAVIAQGGSNAVTVEKITKVIESILNVSTHKISVSKMKS